MKFLMIFIVLAALRFEFPSEELADRFALHNVMRSAERVGDANAYRPRLVNGYDPK